jgi:hypothetical protein
VRDGWVGFAVVFLLAATFTSFFEWSHMRVDATAYWNAGVRLRSGAPVYEQTAVPALAKAYLYPPAFAAVFAPITVLPPLWGWASWMALEVLCAVLLARTCAALAGLDAADRDARQTALALVLAACVVPVYENAAEGQVNVLVALLCASTLLETERGRDGRAALALAAAVHVKLVPIVLAAAFAVWLRARLLCWVAVALVALALLPIVWRVTTMGAGAGTHAFARDYADFWRTIIRPAADAAEIAGSEQLFAPNFSLRGTLSRLFVSGTALSPFPALASRRGPLLVALPRPVVDAASALFGVAAIVTALWACRRAADDRQRRLAAGALLLVAGGLAGPTFWQHHLVIVAVAGAALWPLIATFTRREQSVAWCCAVAPLAVTVTVPYFVALATGGFDAEWYRAVREYGLPTFAVVAFFATGIVVTVRRRAPGGAPASVG